MEVGGWGAACLGNCLGVFQPFNFATFLSGPQTWEQSGRFPPPLLASPPRPRVSVFGCAPTGLLTALSNTLGPKRPREPGSVCQHWFSKHSRALAAKPWRVRDECLSLNPTRACPPVDSASLPAGIPNLNSQKQNPCQLACHTHCSHCFPRMTSTRSGHRRGEF